MSDIHTLFSGDTKSTKLWRIPKTCVITDIGAYTQVRQMSSPLNWNGFFNYFCIPSDEIIECFLLE